MMSRFFIDRPIFATVLALLISLGGIASMFMLPVAQYPNLTPPTVVVSAAYPGASAETVANAIAAPLEQQINGADGMIYMSSNNSAAGTMALVATFAVGTDVYKAAADVQSRVNLALPQMPDVVRQSGVTVTKQNSSLLMIVALQSQDDRYDALYVSDYASLYVLDELKRISGVGKVELSGTGDYALRIWLKPDRMAQLKVTSTDIMAALRDQNAQVAVGRIGAPPTSKPVELTLPVTARGRLSDPRALGEVILRTGADSASVRLKDVARIELGAQSYDFKGTLNGKPATLITVNQAPGANAVQLVGKGSQYAYTFVDSEGKPLDGAKTYKIHLPPNIPAKNFWSIILYDNQTRSDLQTDQTYPSLGSQKKTLVVNADKSVDVYFGPTAPKGHEANWIQTLPGKGWNPMLRLYGPLESWFDKTWRPGEIEFLK